MNVVGPDSSHFFFPFVGLVGLCKRFWYLLSAGQHFPNGRFHVFKGRESGFVVTCATSNLHCAVFEGAPADDEADGQTQQVGVVEFYPCRLVGTVIVETFDARIPEAVVEGVRFPRDGFVSEVEAH